MRIRITEFRFRGRFRLAVAAGVLGVAGCEQPMVPPPPLDGELAAFASSGDRAALMALHESTDGENWKDDTNWGTDEDLSEWHGVWTDDDGRVTALILRDNDLSGRIAPEVGDLARLEWLLLGTNGDLSGSIPPELGDLARLRWLDLYKTSLSGEIPAELENTAMEALVITGTSITGGIPPELGNLANLIALDLRDNSNMSGGIPPELGGLASLEILYLINTGLSGGIPPDLGALSKLKWLHLGGNDLSGGIPSKLGALDRLEHLYLYDNDLSGEVPRSLGGLDALSRLHLSRNNLSGEIPKTWLALDLEEFSVWENSGLCVPNTRAFDIWLGDIPFPLDRWRCEDD